jgi:hypothetical protein
VDVDMYMEHNHSFFGEIYSFILERVLNKSEHLGKKGPCHTYFTKRRAPEFAGYMETVMMHIIIQ